MEITVAAMTIDASMVLTFLLIPRIRHPDVEIPWHGMLPGVQRGYDERRVSQ
jgi:hypothetical protein